MCLHRNISISKRVTLILKVGLFVFIRLWQPSPKSVQCILWRTWIFCSKFFGNPSNICWDIHYNPKCQPVGFILWKTWTFASSCWDISVSTKMVDRLSWPLKRFWGLKKINFAYQCASCKAFWKPLNIAPSIIIFVEQWQQTKNTTTAVGFMIPLHHLLQNHQTLYNAGKASVTHTRKKKTITS